MPDCKVYRITPVPKPRMTQSDRWRRRPAVLRYRAFCDAVREAGVRVPYGEAWVVFTLPMPASWSTKKKQQMQGRPHQQRPDCDNLLKALLDAVYDDDARLYDIRITKRWGWEGAIEVHYAP